MRRLERLTAILSKLQSARFTRIEDLSERFEVSERTIYRDLKSLEEAGVPIGFEKDRGYFVLDRYFLPPLAFTEDEARSFIYVEELARKYTDPEIFGHFSSALTKIKSKLRDHQISEVESLEPNVKAYINKEYEPKFLAVADKACRTKEILKITYKGHSGKETTRTVEPIGLTFYSQNWHLIAYCNLRQDYRDFVLNRISKLENTGAYFEGRISLDEYIQGLK